MSNMRCVFPNCNNVSSQTSQEITYHSFPTEPSLRAAWLEAMHTTSWEPEEHSAVCSNHFLDEDLLLISSGLRAVRADAVPVVNLRVCRICFVTDCKMYAIPAYKVLSNTYETLTGLLIENEDKIPPYLCSKCTHKLLNCARFRSRSLQSHLLLQKIVKDHGCITLKLIQSAEGTHSQLSSNQSDWDYQTGYDLDMELMEIENIYTNQQIGRQCEGVADDYVKSEVGDVTSSCVKNKTCHVNIVRIKSEIDDVTIDHIKKEVDDGNNDCIKSEIDDMAFDSVRNEITVNIDFIKSEIDDKINQDIDNVESNNQMDISNIPEDIVHLEIKTEHCMMNQDSCDEDSSNATVNCGNVFVGEDYYWGDSLRLAALKKKAKLSTTPVEEVATIGNNLSQVKVTAHQSPEAESRLSVHNTLSCEICPYQTNYELQLRSHLKAHGATECYSCNMCSYITVTKQHLALHAKVHSGEKPYSCNICNKVFNQKSHLTKHLRTHSGEKPYSCKFCDKVFNDKSNLTRHLRIHFGEKPYSCDICYKTFKQKPHLTEHLRTHSGEKPFSCVVCNKAFNQKSHLTKHLRTHSGEKPYACDICNKAFNQKPHLTKHLRTHPNI